MQLAETLVSGSLGQAIYFDDGGACIIDESDAPPRKALPNEIAWFRFKARAVVTLDHPVGSLDELRSCLNDEVQLFEALDGLLVGMDQDYSKKVRRRSIVRAERLLSGESFVRRIRERFLIPVNLQEWDPSGALTLSAEENAEKSADCYRPLMDGSINQIAEDIATSVASKLGTDVEASRHQKQIMRSGLLAELAGIVSRRDRKALSALMFKRDEFVGLRTSDPSGQLLATIIHHVGKRLPPDAGILLEQETGKSVFVSRDQEKRLDDPIISAIERALARFEERRVKPRRGSAADVPGIQREVEWIGERLKRNQAERAERALLKLIERQAERSRIEDIVKTLTAVADLSRIAKQTELVFRILDALDRLGVTDAVAMNVRAQSLQSVGRDDEALAVLEETMRRFPQDEVARNTYAEVLRSVGRTDDAFAVLEETMRRFPQNEVAPTAYAEGLRSTGRMNDALALLQETMRRFPNNEVPRNAFAEALRSVGRTDDAFAVLEETMHRFPHDEVAPTAYGQALRSVGRTDESLAVLKETMRRFPHNEVVPNAYAEALRSVGRADEALVVLKETMSRFPQDEVAPTSYAEGLRSAARMDEALVVLEETMRRFPQNVVAPTDVAPNAYAEALRSAGRVDEALLVLEDTMRRFPHNSVTFNAYAHLLAELGRFGEAEALLKPGAQRAQTRDDWIAVHVLAMTYLRTKRIDEALRELERGVEYCTFAEVKSYFLTARPIVLIAARRAEEAVRQLELLARDQSRPKEETTNITLLRVHALAETGQTTIAQNILDSAKIIDFALAKQKRLAMALDERYGIMSGVPASPSKVGELDDNIIKLEFELVQPGLFVSKAA